MPDKLKKNESIVIINGEKKIIETGIKKPSSHETDKKPHGGDKK